MLTENYNGLTVYWEKQLAGGGRAYRQEYLTLFERLPKVDRLFEWCSGPAFIGFSLLAYGHCDKLCLADINPDNIALCKKTIAENELEDRVSLYHSDCLEGIPDTEQWDMVVGNPPHHFAEGTAPNCEKRHKGTGKPLIVSTDYGWDVHRRYYRDLGKHLKPDGFSLICENSQGSSPETFTPMAEENGFSVVYTGETGRRPFYYFGTMLSQEAWENSRWKDGL